jgi:O-acetyl-ADP-ribose deacetylase (regulator of RNase III)
VWSGGDRHEAELLRACYVNSLQAARARGLRSIAFPSISTGAYGYPIEQAARIAVATVRQELAADPGQVELVRFVCFSAGDLAVYQRELIRPSSPS